MLCVHLSMADGSTRRVGSSHLPLLHLPVAALRVVHAALRL